MTLLTCYQCGALYRTEDGFVSGNPCQNKWHNSMEEKRCQGRIHTADAFVLVTKTNPYYIKPDGTVLPYSHEGATAG